MNLQTTIEFLSRLYDNPEGKNLTRLEHEAIGEAIRRLQALHGASNQLDKTASSKSRLRVIPGGKKTEKGSEDRPDT